MKKRSLAVVIVLVFTLLAPLIFCSPTWANNCGGVDTSIIECEETGSGAIGHILLEILDILSIGVGILGVIGITVVGIQYLTAGGNEQQVVKAKKRMVQIVVGLALYVLSFGLLEWLGVALDEQAVTKSNGGSSSSSTNPSNNSRPSNSGGTSTFSGNRFLSRVSAPVLTGIDKNGTTANGRRVLASAGVIAKQMTDMGFKYTCNNKNSWEQMKALSDKKICCHEYVAAVLQDAGLLPKGKSFWLGWGKIHGIDGYDLTKNDNFKITYVHDSVKNLVNSGKLVPGDIVGQGTFHTMIYRGKSAGKYYFYSVNSKPSGYLSYSRVTSKVYSGSASIFVIIHPK